MADIKTSEDRILKKMLAHAALFSQAGAVQEAYGIAYQGDMDNANDPHMAQAGKKLLQ